MCLCAFLLLTGLIFLSQSVYALQSGDFYYTVSNSTVTITGITSQACQLTPTEVIPATINSMPVVSIGDSAFHGCTGLTSVTIPDSVTSIGVRSFQDCTSLTSVTIGNGVTSIGSFAFLNCSKLTSVTIPGSVTSIGDYAFYHCIGLKSVTIGSSVTSIGNSAFGYCISLTIVTIPNSVTSIGSYAFENCTGLASVTIPSSVTSIGAEAFEDCGSLINIVVDASNPAYSSQDGVLYNKTMTVLIAYPGGKSGGFTIPNSVTSIRESAFFNCKGLTNVTIPNSVTSIGIDAFYFCTGLTSVTIPNSVTSIGAGAFYYCNGLGRAYFNGNAPSMGAYVFYNCSINFTVCYTAGSTGFTTPTWYGYPTAACGQPTAIELSSFTAAPKAGKVILQWSTESEIDNAGFNIYRAESNVGNYVKINDALISAQGSSTQGAAYDYIDTNVQNRKTYFYKLEDTDLNGKPTMHGPVSAMPRLICGIGK